MVQSFLALQARFQGQTCFEKDASLQPGEGEEGLDLQDQAIRIDIAQMRTVMPRERAQGPLQFSTFIKI